MLRLAKKTKLCRSFSFYRGVYPRKKTKRKKGKAKNRAKKRAHRTNTRGHIGGGGGTFRNVKYITNPTFIHT